MSVVMAEQPEIDLKINSLPQMLSPSNSVPSFKKNLNLQSKTQFNDYIDKTGQ